MKSLPEWPADFIQCTVEGALDAIRQHHELDVTDEADLATLVVAAMLGAAIPIAQMAANERAAIARLSDEHRSMAARLCGELAK